MPLEDLLKKYQEYDRKPNLNLIRRAYGFAEVAHLGQKRLSGEDLIQHPLAVAEILTAIRADSTTLAAALLHDVLEKSNLGKGALGEEFGEEIAALVDGLTTVKAASIRGVSGEGRSRSNRLENLRRLILATVRDPRVLAIRLAEKIHNLRTSSVIPEDKRKAAAQRVFDIWAPLAAIIGLYHFKGELEDLAFCILQPKECREIRRLVQKESEKMKLVVEQARGKLGKAVKKEGVSARIHSRTKHHYSVYRKLPRYKAKAGGRPYDALGLRVLVGTVEECYRVLDLARSFWKEIPELFDDYIAHPKPNGYQSLHTVLSVDGHLVEIQIRTRVMHEVAEYGLAAHPLYKEGKGSSGENISLIRSLVLWEKGQELDLFPDKVFVFTPKGDVKVLPKGATPVDFAYAVHSRVGDECSGAEVNGRIVSLDYQLKTGEVVRILTTKGKKPSPDWLRFVKTGHARDQVGKVIRRR
ncbi:MAG: hypothetical protein BMS9Abin34_421 [Patescibacteria group bacterium]|nr:MAG: hypothetical protein BMS9Abin34_421 [Patescibacteria group bacterium]